MTKRHYSQAIFFPWPYRKNFLDEITLTIEMDEWCRNNLNGYFTTANDGMYIYDKEDAIAFKLYWDGVDTINWEINKID